MCISLVALDFFVDHEDPRAWEGEVPDFLPDLEG
jgi:hypothetical protein